MTLVRRLLPAVVLAAILAPPAGAQEVTPPPPPPPPPSPATIAQGVTIAAVPVGRMTAEQASATVRAAFDRPMKFAFRNRRWRVTPARLGGVPSVSTAVDQALAAWPGQAVPLAVRIRGTRLRAYVGNLDRFFSRPARSSRLVGLRNLRPFITKSRPGVDVRRRAMTRVIARALRRHDRGPLALRVNLRRPTVTRSNFGAVIVIRRGSRRLYLYDGMAHWRTFRIAVGMPAYPTPVGRFTIATKERNPTWNPPDSDWARGLGPVPPGPGNPLGTRWMGLSAYGYGIHGTPSPETIGTAASHGCIRMYIRESEWLFERVRVGTTVFIVRA
jgi:L,D-transpeptidase catalytic domain